MHTPSPISRRLLVAPTLFILLAVLLGQTSVLVHARLTECAEAVFPGYRDLREEPSPPDCDRSGSADTHKALVPSTQHPDDEALALIDDLVDAEPPSEEAQQVAIAASRAECEAQWAGYEDVRARRTSEVIAFRAVEHAVEYFRDVSAASQRTLLLILLLLGAATATVSHAHISLRPPRSRADHRVAEAGQFLANAVIGLSVLTHYRLVGSAGAVGMEPWLYFLWIGGSAGLMALNIRNWIMAPTDTAPKALGWRSLLCIPLYVIMASLAAGYFVLVENHLAGISIYLSKLLEFARLYLQLTLFVALGMLIKQTRIPRLIFDVFRPLGLSAPLLAGLVVVLTAWPTAITGASGVWVIAAGALIYEELRMAGASRQLALSTTALSGSLGVVLSPCLLVVVIASLNKQVTTSELYGWGFWVYLLTSSLCVLGMLLRGGREAIRMHPAPTAAKDMGRALFALVPYGLVVAIVLAAYHFGLDVRPDFNWAAIVLPVAFLFVLAYDRRKTRRGEPPENASSGGWLSATWAATADTGHNFGAVLPLMAVSIVLGGVFERADILSVVPSHFGSPFLTMAVLVAALVLIGMMLDSYGAVIVVSATLAHVAYANGIHPVHFWIVVMVSFELAYLTPPVALNQLLTRHVVGEEEYAAAVGEGNSFSSRYENMWLPVTVMGTALLLVAFVPLWFI